MQVDRYGATELSTLLKPKIPEAYANKINETIKLFQNAKKSLERRSTFASTTALVFGIGYGAMIAHVVYYNPQNLNEHWKNSGLLIYHIGFLSGLGFGYASSLIHLPMYKLNELLCSENKLRLEQESSSLV